MVVRSAFALSRAFDLLANCPLHRLPGDSVHLGDLDPLRIPGDSGSGVAMEGSEGSDRTILISSRVSRQLVSVLEGLSWACAWAGGAAASDSFWRILASSFSPCFL